MSSYQIVCNMYTLIFFDKKKMKYYENFGQSHLRLSEKYFYKDCLDDGNQLQLSIIIYPYRTQFVSVILVMSPNTSVRTRNVWILSKYQLIKIPTGVKMN